MPNILLPVLALAAGTIMMAASGSKAAAAQKDAKKLSSAGLRSKAEKLIDILRKNPLMTPPPYEKLLGDLSGAFSRSATATS